MLFVVVARRVDTTHNDMFINIIIGVYLFES